MELQRKCRYAQLFVCSRTNYDLVAYEDEDVDDELY